MEPKKKPLPWWTEYLGIRINRETLGRRAVQGTGLAYFLWIIPPVLVSFFTTLLGFVGIGRTCAPSAQQTPVQARPKDVAAHVPSQTQNGTVTLEARNLFGVAAVSASSNFNFRVVETIPIGETERVSIKKSLTTNPLEGLWF